MLDNGMRERSRDHSHSWVGGRYSVKPGTGSPPSDVVTNISIRTHERTIDKENTGWALINALWKAGKLTTRQKNFWRRQDLGGPFLNEKQTYNQVATSFSKELTIGWGPNSLRYKNWQACLGVPVGNIIPTSSVWPTLSPDDIQELWGLGSSAIKNTAPGLPSESLSTFVGELLEGLPKLAWKFSGVREGLNSTSSNYLAYQFGVKPMLSDIKSILGSVSKLDRELARLEEMSGEIFHRKFSFDDTKDVTFVGSTAVYAWPSAPSNVHPGSGVRSEYLLTEEKTWFAAAYSFYFPQARDGLSKLKAYLEILGAAPNLDTVWNLSPYSWLADWFANFGDVMFNLSYLTDNSRILIYGYLMRTSTITRRYEWSKAGVGTSTQDFTVTRKVRIKASPFGFGLRDEDLTPFQWSILSALGIQRFT